MTAEGNWLCHATLWPYQIEINKNDLKPIKKELKIKSTDKQKNRFSPRKSMLRRVMLMTPLKHQTEKTFQKLQEVMFRLLKS